MNSVLNIEFFVAHLYVWIDWLYWEEKNLMFLFYTDIFTRIVTT